MEMDALTLILTYHSRYITFQFGHYFSLVIKIEFTIVIHHAYYRCI